MTAVWNNGTDFSGAGGICKLHSPGLAGLKKVDYSTRLGLGKVLGCSVDTRGTSYRYRKCLALLHSLPNTLWSPETWSLNLLPGPTGTQGTRSTRLRVAVCTRV